MAEKSERLEEAIRAGMVAVDEERKHARILAPPDVDELSDEAWLDLIAVASGMVRELEGLGYTVDP